MVLSWFFHISWVLSHLCEDRSLAPRAESHCRPRGQRPEQGSPQELPHCGQPHLGGQGSSLPALGRGTPSPYPVQLARPLLPLPCFRPRAAQPALPWALGVSCQLPDPAGPPTPAPPQSWGCGLQHRAEVPSTQCLFVLQVRLWR